MLRCSKDTPKFGHESTPDWLCAACGTSNFLTRLSCRSLKCVSHSFTVHEYDKEEECFLFEDLASPWKCTQCSWGKLNGAYDAKCSMCFNAREDSYLKTLFMVSAILNRKNPRSAMFVAKSLFKGVNYNEEAMLCICKMAKEDRVGWTAAKKKFVQTAREVRRKTGDSFSVVVRTLQMFDFDVAAVLDFNEHVKQFKEDEKEVSYLTDLSDNSTMSKKVENSNIDEYDALLKMIKYLEESKACESH